MQINSCVPSGLENLERNPGENLCENTCLGLISLKSIVIFKQDQRAVELSNKASSRKQIKIS